MSESVFHVRKFSLGLKRKYRISADDGAGRPGALLTYAEKQLKVSEEIVLFRDEHRTERLATVRESSAGLRAALTAYEVFDADEKVAGSFRVLVRESLTRTTWHFDQPGLATITGSERSMKTARLRRLIGLGAGAGGEIANALMKYHFDFALDGDPVFSIEKPKVLDDWYRLTVHCESIDRTLLFALAVTMEARQRA